MRWLRWAHRDASAALGMASGFALISLIIACPLVLTMTHWLRPMQASKHRRSLPGPSGLAEIGPRPHAIGRVSIKGPVGIAEIKRRRLSGVIGAVIEIIDRADSTAVGSPTDTVDPRRHADLGRDDGPPLMRLCRDHRDSCVQGGRDHRRQRVSHLHTLEAA